MAFVDFLVDNAVIDRSVVGRIEQDMAAGDPIDKAALAAGAQAELVFQAKQEFFSGYEVRLQENEQAIPAEILQYIPENSAQLYGFVPLAVTAEGELEVGILDPDNLSAKSALEFISGSSGPLLSPLPHLLRLLRVCPP